MTQTTRTRLTLLVALALALLRAPLAAAMQALLPDLAQAPLMNYAAMIAQSLVLFALPGCLLMPAWRTQRRTARESWIWVLLALGLAALARAVSTPLNAWWAEKLGAPGSLLPRAEGPLENAVQLLAVAVIPAAAEEIFFRGALLTNLLQRGSRTQALLLTTAMFALMHGSLPGLPGHLLISLVLTLLMLCGGRLYAPVLAHMVYNLLALAGATLPAWTAWLAGGLLLAALAWLLTHLPMGKARRLPWQEWALCGLTLAAMAAQYLL